MRKGDNEGREERERERTSVCDIVRVCVAIILSKYVRRACSGADMNDFVECTCTLKLISIHFFMY